MMHGKKFRKLRDKKFMIGMLIGLLIVILVTLTTLVSLTILKKNTYTDTTKISDVLRDKQFIIAIESDEEREGYNKNAFNLKQQDYFGGDVAIKNGNIYGIERPVDEVYKRYQYNYLTSALMNTDLTVGDVKSNNHEVILTASKVITLKFLKEENPPVLEQLYKVGDFTEAKITFNNKFWELYICLHQPQYVVF